MSDIVLSQKIINDDYTSYLYSAYDIQDRNESVTVIKNNLNLDFDFNVGVIFGASGSGKSVLLKTLGEVTQPTFDNSKALISNFPNLKPEEVSYLLASVGLGSVPAWLRTHSVLSNGEQYRAELAKLLSEEKDLYLIDEYTSVVDRNVAKSMSNALQKYVRRTNKKLVVATPHQDVIDFLEPNWVYSTETCQLERADGNFRRPKLELEISRCFYETWNLFKSHHYLTPNLHKSSACFLVTWENQIVAFTATLDFPGLPHKAKRFTRTVTLPDFQGLGIGTTVRNYLAGLYLKAGYVCYARTVNPALGEPLGRSGLWRVTKEYKKRDRVTNDIHTGDKKYLQKYLLNRPSYALKYVGPPIEDNLDIVLKKNKEL
jgi:ABC-type lipoprotein export system ATPase subunit/GNAT superfamily N-acetyltransferase